jgi:alcohol dehydrogenase, propanol-preferring
MGYTIDRGFGEYATAYARYVVKAPEGVDTFDAAPLTCAGVTTYKAIKVAGTRSSDFVAVFGVRRSGTPRDPVCSDRRRAGRRGRRDRSEARARARARRRVHYKGKKGRPSRGDPAARRRRPGDRPRRLAPCLRASVSVAASRREARVRPLPADNEVNLPMFETVLNGITISGSIVGTRKDLREVFELHHGRAARADHRHGVRETKCTPSSPSSEKPSAARDTTSIRNRGVPQRSYWSESM